MCSFGIFRNIGSLGLSFTRFDFKNCRQCFLHGGITLRSNPYAWPENCSCRRTSKSSQNRLSDTGDFFGGLSGDGGIASGTLGISESGYNPAGTFVFLCVWCKEIVCNAKGK